MSSFAVRFLGCKVSQADAMTARAAMLAAGHRETAEGEAELHVINTCAITSEAEAKSRQAVRRSLRRVERVFVSGCAANRDAGQFAGLDARVTPLVGTAEDVAGTLADGLGACADLEHGARPGGRAPAGDPERRDPARAGPTRAGGRSNPARLAIAPHAIAHGPGVAGGEPARTRGFVKVQDGCDCHCAYCIIPTVRGGARSRPASAVLREVAARVAQGQPEMVMTGISVGDYGDPERGLELGQLMCEVARVPGVQRVRLSSVEVIHVKDSLVHALVTEPKICPHLHIPLQSGDDGVLAAMGRHYTADEYLEHVRALRAAVPEVNVTTDVIVGFPTETEQAFARTLALLDAAQISRVHAFSYSPRPGTVAEALGDAVAAEEKKHRSRELRGRSELRSRQHRAAKLGAVEWVLVDKAAITQCSGYTPDYTRCYLPADAAKRGELVPVHCTELHADGLACELAQGQGYP